MKAMQDFLDEGYEIKTSHADIWGRHWVIMQKGAKAVIVKLHISMWTGKPSTSVNQEYWEIN